MSIVIKHTTYENDSGKNFTTVNGHDVTTLSDDDVVDIITQQEVRIATLTATKAKPVKLQNTAKQLKAQLQTFVALLDEQAD